MKGTIEAKEVDVTSLPKGKKSSQYDTVIAQAQALETGKGLEVTNPENKHLVQTLNQLIKRRELDKELSVRSAAGRVVIVRL